jgi:hypothetical protein
LSPSRNPGVEDIGRAADRLRTSLALSAEHHHDEELRYVVELLAASTMLVAEDLGMDDASRR